jgi:hypothetical protein
MSQRLSETVYDSLYTNVGSFHEDCVYCGLPATGWDHVPPLHLVARMAEEDRNRANLRKYPSCKECNSFLGGLILRTFSERKARVKQKLRQKYRKYLGMVDWSEEELDEVDPRSRALYLEPYSKLSKIVKFRIAW